MDDNVAKGVGIIAVRNYVKEKHANQYKEWLRRLSSESNKIISNELSANKWYSLKHGVIDPMKLAAEMFHNNDHKLTGIETGKFSADYTLNGVYRVFLMIATPKALMSASQRIVSRFYNDAKVIIDESKSNSFIFSASKMDNKYILTDYNIIGWSLKALELIKCKNVQFEELEDKYSGMFSVRFSWE